MFSKSDLIASLRHEAQVCKHLFTKIPEGALSYRPTEDQRSLQQLLQYLTVCVRVPLECMLSCDWSKAKAEVEKSSAVAVEDFPAAMDRQIEQAESILSEITENELLNREVALPLGRTAVLGPALVNLPLKFITAYRMQLFLYMKGAGVKDLSTSNCWFGIDRPQS